MAREPDSANIYASDLLGTPNRLNAITLNGLESDKFLRTDVTSFPLVDASIDLGSNTRRFNNIFARQIWGIESINGEDFSNFLKRNIHNLPTINSNGSTGYDLGGVNNFWRTVYARNGTFGTIYADNMLTVTGDVYSHKSLTDIGVNTHVQIDSHINTRNVTSIANNANVHGATWATVANTIMARDGNGDTNARYFYGIAQKALYADLAEKYTSKEKAPVGTVYCISNDELYDVEICQTEYNSTVIGVVSENPGLVMNEGIDGVLLGLKGKLKIRVIGPVKKGDILVSAGNGCAKSAESTWLAFKIGIANETNINTKEKLIEAIL